VGLIASGYSKDEILALHPYLEGQDIDQALKYAAWRVDESICPWIVRPHEFTNTFKEIEPQITQISADKSNLF